MQTLSPGRALDAHSRASARSAATHLVVVVGYDGSPPAQRALEGAVRLLNERHGFIEVVYVAHPLVTAGLSPEGLAAASQGFDLQARSLEEEVEERSFDHPWHFQRRDGSVASELMAVAADLQQQYDDETEVVVVVGGPAHRYHRLGGSVGATLIRSDRFPVIVVP